MTEQVWRPALLNIIYHNSTYAIFEISAWKLMVPRVSLVATPFYYVAFSFLQLRVGYMLDRARVRSSKGFWATLPLDS